jgi:proline iminopeptidase
MTKPWLLWLAIALGGCLDPEDPGNLVPKTVVEDPTLPRIEVNGTWLHAEAFGEKNAPAVMVLHGGPGSDYRGLLPLRALADDGFRVVFWDQRGTGLSQRHDSDVFTYAVYLEDLRLVIEQTIAPGQPFVFIGHSWGAMYATWFINEYGDYSGRVRGAILSEPGAFTKRQLDGFMDRLIASIDLTSEQLNDAAWLGQFLSAGDHARADYQYALLALRGAPSERRDPQNPTPMWRAGAVANRAMLQMAEDDPFDWTTNLRAFAPKVLFLRGDLNTAATLEHQKELAASYPSAEIVTMANIGHEMIWERPEEYLRETRAYFQSIGFAGGAR